MPRGKSIKKSIAQQQQQNANEGMHKSLLAASKAAEQGKYREGRNKALTANAAKAQASKARAQSQAQAKKAPSLLAGNAAQAGADFRKQEIVNDNAARGRAQGLARAENMAKREAQEEERLKGAAAAGKARGLARSTVGADAATASENAADFRSTEEVDTTPVIPTNTNESEVLPNDTQGEEVGFSANTGKEGDSLMSMTKDYMADVMQGRDAQSQQIMNRFSEEGAAAEVAARGKAGQEAQLQDLSQSTQNVMGMMTDRNLEGAKQQGIADLASDAGKTADAAVANLQGIASEEIARDRADLVTGMNAAIAAGDFEGAKRLGSEAGFGDIDYSYVQDIQNDNISSAAQGKLIGHVTNNKNSYIGEDGAYDSDKLLADPLMKDEFGKIWEAERGSITGEEWDPDNNPEQQAWAKTYADNQFVTESQDISNTFMAEAQTYLNSEDFLDLPEDQQNLQRDSIEAIADGAGLGLDFKWDEDTNTMTTIDKNTGVTIDATAKPFETATGGTITVDDGVSTYETPDGEVWEGEIGIDGNLEIKDENGETLNFSSQDGKWVSEEPFEANKFVSSNLNTKMEEAFNQPGKRLSTGKYAGMTYDEESGVLQYGGKGGSGRYMRDGAGNWYEVKRPTADGDFEPCRDRS